MKNKILAAIMAAAMLTVTGCGGSSSPSQAGPAKGNTPSPAKEEQTVLLKLNHVQSNTDPVQEAFLELADMVKERSGGSIEIQVYANSELGSNKDNLEQAVNGANIIAVGDTGFLADYVPDFGIMNGPFLYSSYEDLIDQGFLTEAVVNFVALLGWSPEDNQEIVSLEELVEKFDYRHMSKSPAVFDYGKLKWMNGEYIKAMDFEAFYEKALPIMKEVITKEYDFRKIAQMVKTRIEIFPDIRELIDFFEEVPEYDVSMYTHKKMKTNAETSLTVLKEVLPLLETQEDYSNDALYGMLSAYVAEKGYKNGYVMWPIRTAASGKQMTPCGATEILEIIGKEESIARIKKAIEKLS